MLSATLLAAVLAMVAAPPPALQSPPPVAALRDGPPPARAPVAFPHPLIVEVLYAVPSGPDGDASGDGKRDAAGDEFIELVNPHDRPINLRGYRITDRNEPGKGQLSFTFPAVEVPPGGVVVVFNGFNARWEGPVGDAKKAPETGNGRFAGALTFTMKGTSGLTSWANGGDWALLSDPAGSPVHCVWWGKFAEKLPAGGVVEQAPLTSKGSVVREEDEDGKGEWVVHGDVEDVPFSPGRRTPPSPPPPSPPATTGGGAGGTPTPRPASGAPADEPSPARPGGGE